MSIQHILNQKGADVVAIDAAQDLREALRTMDRRQIGALLVRSTTGELGIFTERDVMRALATHDTPCLDEPVSQHMTSRPHIITPKTSVNEAMEIMTEKRFRHLPVMDGDKLCGIISIGDLVNYRIHESEAQAKALKDYITS